MRRKSANGKAIRKGVSAFKFTNGTKRSKRGGKGLDKASLGKHASPEATVKRWDGRGTERGGTSDSAARGSQLTPPPTSTGAGTPESSTTASGSEKDRSGNRAPSYWFEETTQRLSSCSRQLSVTRHAGRPEYLKSSEGGNQNLTNKHADKAAVKKNVLSKAYSGLFLTRSRHSNVDYCDRKERDRKSKVHSGAEHGGRQATRQVAPPRSHLMKNFSEHLETSAKHEAAAPSLLRESHSDPSSVPLRASVPAPVAPAPLQPVKGCRSTIPTNARTSKSPAETRNPIPKWKTKVKKVFSRGSSDSQQRKPSKLTQLHRETPSQGSVSYVREKSRRAPRGNPKSGESRGAVTLLSLGKSSSRFKSSRGGDRLNTAENAPSRKLLGVRENQAEDVRNVWQGGTEVHTSGATAYQEQLGNQSTETFFRRLNTEPSGGTRALRMAPDDADDADLATFSDRTERKTQRGEERSPSAGALPAEQVRRKLVFADHGPTASDGAKTGTAFPLPKTTTSSYQNRLVLGRPGESQSTVISPGDCLSSGTNGTEKRLLGDIDEANSFAVASVLEQLAEPADAGERRTVAILRLKEEAAKVRQQVTASPFMSEQLKAALLEVAMGLEPMLVSDSEELW